MDSKDDFNTALNEIDNDDELDEAAAVEIYSDEDDYQDADHDYGDDYPVSESMMYEEYSTTLKRKKHRVLNETDIRKLMEDSITEVSTVLSIPKDMASNLLRYFRWSVTEVTDAWFSDEFRVRKKLGLMLEKQEIQFPDELTCGICFESYSHDGLSWDKCGHPFCNDCWANYISNYISEGAGPLMIRCPEPSCRAALSQELFDKIATQEQKERFLSYLVKSFVESKGNIKWCPANGCEYAIELDIGVGSCDVSCLCSHIFCWNCKEEAHRPMGCDIIATWNEKTNSEERTKNRIMVCTKPCPKCKRPIEKSIGCMHMTCRPPCNFEFCWICLKKWDGHWNFYGCNRFSEVISEKMKEKESRKKYLHCCDRWEAHGISRRKAVTDLENLKTQQIKKLGDIQQLVASELDFLVEAWKQIIECRQILRWTYACRYFLSENEHGKIELFEFLQGQAESGLERLHSCAERGVGEFLIAVGPSQNFDEFRKKLIGLTSVTRNYFENLVNAMENGLSDDVESKPVADPWIPIRRPRKF